MKVIISHDVDHLNVREHWKDLYYPKLFLRSFLQVIRHQIVFKVFFNRLFSVFDKRIHRIPELCLFDKENGVKATYFFGMSHALGMVYKTSQAQPWITYVKGRGFDVGVHGCDYQNYNSICKEHDDFAELTGEPHFGIRNHYVRYDDDTFNKMNMAGYLFDTSLFNKTAPVCQRPYKVGDMWEFPLAIMDTYVVRHNLEKAKEVVINLVEETIKCDGVYLTVLFHDTYFNEKCYPVEKAFYEWLICYLKTLGLEFVSYKDAIKELEHV